jgi:hypothetical protein
VVIGAIRSRDQQEWEFEMLSFAHRVRRVMIVFAIAGGATLALAAPSAAAPSAATQPAPPQKSECGPDFAGNGPCVNYTWGDTPETTTASAILAVENSNPKGVLIVLEACDGPDRCRPVAVGSGIDSGGNPAEVRLTNPPKAAFYRANASWVGREMDIHTGITTALLSTTRPKG